MSIFQRLTDMGKAKMTQALNDAEDPNETLDYSYEKQLDMLQKVRRGIAEVTTSKVQVQNRLSHAREQATRLTEQARQALGLGREDVARTALTRKTTIDAQVVTLAAQAEDLEAQQGRLMDGEARLAAKIDAFRTGKEVMKAQYSAAQAQVHIGEAATGLSEEMGNTQLALQRAQDKIERLQARGIALDELAGTEAFPELMPGQTDLDTQLGRLSAGDEVERQLAVLRLEAPPQHALSEAPPTDAVWAEVKEHVHTHE